MLTDYNGQEDPVPYFLGINWNCRTNAKDYTNFMMQVEVTGRCKLYDSLLVTIFMVPCIGRVNVPAQMALPPLQD